MVTQAIFDATLVHILSTVAPAKWHPLKVSRLCTPAYLQIALGVFTHTAACCTPSAPQMQITESLIINKQQRTLEIIQQQCAPHAAVQR